MMLAPMEQANTAESAANGTRKNDMILAMTLCSDEYF
jgi:hypothetical protein